MKNITIIILLCFVSYQSFSQSAFDKSLNEVSADMAAKLSRKNKKKIVVLYITNIKNTQTVAGKYIADVISYNLVNNSGNFLVFDRENLSEITEAKKLITEGYIDAAKAKELGKILAVETIIIGHYTVFSSTLKLSLKALDVNSGLVIAATMKDLPLNEDAGVLLGINVGSNNSLNRGFNNRPLNSNENYNNPETVNKDCERNDTGDYCFTNQTKQELTVYHSNNYGGLNTNDILILKPGETLCFYNFKSGSYKFVVTNKNQSAGYRSNWLYSGNFLVEKCKSKTFNIK